MQPRFVPQIAGGTSPLKVWVQSALFWNVFPAVRSGALTLAASQTASMAKPAL